MSESGSRAISSPIAVFIFSCGRCRRCSAVARSCRCCPEEIAFRQGFIDRRQLGDLARTLGKSGYGQYLESVLSEQEVLRQTVDDIVRDFIEKERRHMEMEERILFPAAAKALLPEDWAEIDARLRSDSSLDRANEEKFNSLRQRILRWEQESASGTPIH